VRGAKLSLESGEWIVGGEFEENLGREDVHLESLEAAYGSTAVSSSLEASSGPTAFSKECLDVARAMVDTLQQATLPASESDVTGRILLFADETGKTTGIPSVETCVNALGLKLTFDGYDVRAVSTVEARDWSNPKYAAFCYEKDEMQDEDDWYDDDKKIVATTKVMISELTDHFEFNMSDEIVCAPVLYGGRKENAIIAVLSMRVWT